MARVTFEGREFASMAELQDEVRKQNRTTPKKSPQAVVIVEVNLDTKAKTFTEYPSNQVAGDSTFGEGVHIWKGETSSPRGKVNYLVKGNDYRCLSELDGTRAWLAIKANRFDLLQDKNAWADEKLQYRYLTYEQHKEFRAYRATPEGKAEADSKEASKAAYKEMIGAFRTREEAFSVSPNYAPPEGPGPLD